MTRSNVSSHTSALWMYAWLVPLALASVSVTVWWWKISWQARIAFDYSEPEILNQVIRCAKHLPLYNDLNQPPYLVTNYTPLFMWLAALWTDPHDFTYLPGRCISFASYLGILAVFVWHFRKVYAQRFPLVFGLAGLLSIPYFQIFATQYSMSMMASFLSFAALILYMHRSHTWHLLAVALLSVLALMTKQSEVLLAIVLAFDLVLHDRKAFLLFLAGFAAFSLAFFVPLQLLTGGKFLLHVVRYTALGFSRHQFLLVCQLYLVWFLPWVALGICMCCRRLSRGAGCVLDYYYIALVLWIPSVARHGSSSQYFLNLYLIATFYITHAAVDARFDLPKRLTLSKRTLTLWLFLPMAGHLYVGATRFSDLRSQQAMVAESTAVLLTNLKDDPGPIFSEDGNVILFSGHDIWVQPFIIAELSRLGRWNDTPIQDFIKKRFFKYIIANSDWLQEGVYDLDRVTPIMLKLFKRNYKIAYVLPGYYVFRPK